MRILITGSRGQLGSELINIAPKKYEVFGFDIDMDITNVKAIEDKFSLVKPDIVIHCAAYTDVDGCEDNVEKAYLVNCLGTENVALVASRYGCEFVYISTDYVFDGEKTSPYIEYDIPNPLSIYGKSKLGGEKVVSQIIDKFYIVRTTGIYSKYGKNFVETIIKNSKDSKTKGVLKVVDDQICTPTYSKDLAECIYSLIDTKMYGIYHATNNGQCSWYEFAREIFNILTLNKIYEEPVNILPIKSKDLTNRKAKRPAYSVLSNFKLEKRNIFYMREWKDALKDFLEEFKNFI